MASTSRMMVSQSNFNRMGTSNPSRKRRSPTSIRTTNQVPRNIFTSSPPNLSLFSPSFKPLVRKFPSFRTNTRHKQASASVGVTVFKLPLLLNPDTFIVDLKANLQLSLRSPFVLRPPNRFPCNSLSAVHLAPRLPNPAVIIVKPIPGSRSLALRLEVRAFLTRLMSIHSLSPRLLTSAAALLPTPSEILTLVICNRFYCCSSLFWLVQSILYYFLELVP
jgi:hypothetical protein